MTSDPNSKTGEIRFRLTNGFEELTELISKNNPDQFPKSSVARDLFHYGIMWMIEFFPSVRYGDMKAIEDVLKQIRQQGTESIALKIKIQNIISQNKTQMKGGEKA